MDEIISGIVTILLIVYMAITGPILNTFQFADKAADNYVNRVTNSFQKEVRNNGYVDLNTYLKFRMALLNTKKDYDVVMICERKDAFPESDNNYENYFVENTNQQILKTIENKKRYEMNYGDNFTVTVKEKGLSNYKLLNMILYKTNNPQSKYIFAKYGGMVQNEE
ncbi:MAG: hypothetical protein LKF87_12280 [Clostridium tyrobutyricum]|jgi:hypothetical protein|uniref:hypothetical protein n=1 Tax=Clostridium tyrobutyricum TaxID=1519 RepID=UPI00242B01ED|nr:hypothetical protein [Clostridium tyrobutyricum]MCH4200567.1 hypothetical protein [Clostridium tyrobutyricum]MCH4237586.1 hypothetical protein [Clostridium tyrobutyricum]MCH4259703.1 hypothetical protein [Clostridium tyrobutyricum]